MKKTTIPLFIFFIISILTGCITLEKNIIIKDLKVNELEDSNHEFLITLKNENSQIGECDILIKLDGKLIKIIKIGLIKPGEERTERTEYLLREDKTDIKVESQCKWSTKEELENCGDIEDTNERRMCYLTYNKPELEKCVVSEHPLGYQIFCMALISDDTDYCNSIPIPPKKYWCKAYVSKDFSQCDNIEDDAQRDWCYMDIGMNIRDEELCNNIKDEKKKITCNAAITLNADLCLTGDENYKVTCVVNIAEFKGDISLCDKLGTLSNECYETLNVMQ